ncbi:MAG: AAA family ATPase [Candidatus Saccharimonadia bacterium]
MQKSNLIIGVVGTLAAGKDEVADYLAKKIDGEHVSTAEELRDYVTEHHLGGLDRDNLRIVANQLRAEQGGDFLVRLALAHKKRPIILSAMRSPLEVHAILEAGGILIAIDAPVMKRYDWAKHRGRIDDAVTAEQFRLQEEAELAHLDPNHQQIFAVMEMAHYRIANDDTLLALRQKVDEVFDRIILNSVGKTTESELR